MAWSPYKNIVKSFVAENPGCNKYEVACFITYRRNPSKSYSIINTAIRHEWIYAHKNKSGEYSLFATEEELEDYLIDLEEIIPNKHLKQATAS